VCNGGEVCQSGICIPGAGLNCDDGNACTADSCDAVLGCQHVPVANGTACSDGLFCTTADACVAGTCVGGAPRDCSSLTTVCTLGVCNDTIDNCEAQPRPNGYPCSDNDICTTGDSCFFGLCSGTPLVCDDGNTCTADSCDAVLGCQSVPVANGTSCTDGNACTSSDVCTAGVCGGTPVVCSDGDPCTADACNPTSGCFATPMPNGASCEDGLFCTVLETCLNGSCIAGGGRDCSAIGDQCNAGQCDETTDACVPLPFPNGTPCAGDPCLAGETCVSGTCQGGVPETCNDGSVCTADACDPLVGCVSTPINCTDADPCTVDSCNPVSGCSHVLDPLDSDSDGRRNACDACPQDAANDVDGDGVCGNVDNCPTVFNPEQFNVDGDSLGDLCDSDSRFVDASSACTSTSCTACGTSALPYPTLARALTCATTRRAIIVRPGTYIENLTLPSVQINLTGSGGPSVTTIQGGGTEPTIKFTSGSKKSIAGLTISNVGTGGGIRAEQTTIDIRNNVLTANRSSGDGAAIKIVGGSGIVTQNVIAGNQTTAGKGGAIYLQGSSVKVLDNRIQNNSARVGGGMYVTGSISEIADNDFEGNMALTHGGGIAVDASIPKVLRNRFVGNVATPGGGLGGGAYIARSTPEFEDNLFQTNSAFSGGGIFVEEASTRIERNRLLANFALGGSGGGVALRNAPKDGSGTPAVVVNNYLVDNISLLTGGAISCDVGSKVQLVNNTLVRNSANQSGAGIFVGTCTADVTNNIVVDSALTHGIFCTVASAPTIGPNNVFNNPLGNYGGLCLPNANDLVEAPTFLAATCPGDYRLAPGSAPIDEGTNVAANVPTEDLEGDARPQDGDLDGFPVVDFGADEFTCDDKDGDGFSVCTSVRDCDDTKATVHPFAQEICDGLDNDCDCLIDEGPDGDGDGFTACGGDCDDADPVINPSAVETCDGVDNNCNGAIDEQFVDSCVSGAQVAVALGAGIGEAGMSAGVTASLVAIDPAAQVAATSNDIQFDAALFGGATPVCAINSAIGPGTPANKSLVQNLLAPGRLRVAVANLNNAVIPPGDLYTCPFPIAASAAAGTYALLTQATASDPAGTSLPTNGLAGTITVLAGPGTTPTGGLIGDCDGNGTVSIAEVQTTTNIFLALQPVTDCPAADANGDDVVDVTEVQNATNNHLGL
jgi:hypothetical protein